jgi:hypothetical protein
MAHDEIGLSHRMAVSEKALNDAHALIAAARLAIDDSKHLIRLQRDRARVLALDHRED